MRLAAVVIALFLLAGGANAVPFGVGPMKHTVTDARGAILVARAMMLALDANSPASPAQQSRWLSYWSDQAWLDHCDAILDHGVWTVTNKGLHKARTGYFTGAAAIYIGADDGRFLGQLFAD